MVTNRYIGGGNDQVGTIIQYFGSNPPKGFLSCDGSIYSIVDYSRLANHIEIEFGSKNFFGGDGTATFAVPDLRGEFLRGTGTNGATEISGSNVGYHQDGTKNINFNFSNVSNNAYLGFRVNSSSGQDLWVVGADSNMYSTVTNGKSTAFYSSNNWTETTKQIYAYISRPTNTSVLFCIRW